MATTTFELTGSAGATEAARFYGQWNALLADQLDGPPEWAPAHDGDFFPESPFDYIAVLRSAVKAGDPELTQPVVPVRVDIDITQVCNARCTFCFSRPYQTQEYRKATVRRATLREVLPQLRELGTRTVRFCGGGEPFAHPEIDALLALPHEHDLAFCVITSMDLVDDARASGILDHVDHLRWSVNAGSDRTRLAIHRPARGASLLSQSIRRVQQLVRRRSAESRRKPLIWATYLIVPENVHEIVDCARQMHEIGVDSISFRPVFHGLHTAWSARERTILNDALLAVKQLDRPPGFHVFTPKRDLDEAEGLVPKQHFEQCLSRKLRTVLEPTEGGSTLQSCGMYRGSGARVGHVLHSAEGFPALWQRFQQTPMPVIAPQDCAECIDVSINKTLAFIADVLRRNPDARLRRARVEAGSGIAHPVE